MNLIERVKRLLLNPKDEWLVIDKEVVDTASLYKFYIAPLVAIGPVCSMIGLSLVGMTLPMMGTYHMPFGAAVVQAILNFALMLGGVYGVALIIDGLAPTFGAQRNKMQALKLAAYASTASWLGGVFTLIPAFGMLSLLAALYSLYLFYLGLPLLMQVPEEKVVGYLAVVVISAIALFIVVGAVSSLFVRLPMPMLPAGAGH